MATRTPFVATARAMSTRAVFRARKPKLGAEPRTSRASALAPSSSTTPPTPPSSFSYQPPTQTSSPASATSSIATEPGAAASTTILPSSPTHYAITLHRSAIGLPDGITRTLEALGIHRRMQTVYHRFSPDIAGKILQVKDLIQVQLVNEQEVMTPEEARNARKAVRGYEVVSRAKPSGLPSLAQTFYAERKGSATRGYEKLESRA